MSYKVCKCRVMHVVSVLLSREGGLFVRDCFNSFFYWIIDSISFRNPYAFARFSIVFVCLSIKNR